MTGFEALFSVTIDTIGLSVEVIVSKVIGQSILAVTFYVIAEFLSKSQLIPALSTSKFLIVFNRFRGILLQIMIRFASINIEGDTNRERIVAFLGDYKPDVVCFQELIETSVLFFENALSMKGHFLPMTKSHAIPRDIQSPIAAFGVGIFSSLPISKIHSDYYHGGVGNLPTIRFKKGAPEEATLLRGLLFAPVTKGPESHTIVTTHFTRTKDGRGSGKQRKDLKNLLLITKKSPE